MIHLVLSILDLDYEEIFFQVEFLVPIYYLQFIFYLPSPILWITYRHSWSYWKWFCLVAYKFLILAANDMSETRGKKAKGEIPSNVKQFWCRKNSIYFSLKICNFSIFLTSTYWIPVENRYLYNLLSSITYTWCNRNNKHS